MRVGDEKRPKHTFNVLCGAYDCRWLASDQLADPYRLRGSFPKACPWIGVQVKPAFFNISLTFRKDAMERQAESGALDPQYNLLKEFHYHRVQRP